MSICKKRIISLSLFFAFTFISTVGFYFQKQQEAFAEPITLTATGMYFLCASLLVASGVILENSNDIISVASQAYNEFKNETAEMKAKIIEFIPKKSPTPEGDGNGWFKPTAFGLAWMSDLFSNLKNTTDVVENEDYKSEPIKTGDEIYTSLGFPTSMVFTIPNNITFNFNSDWENVSRAWLEKGPANWGEPYYLHVTGFKDGVYYPDKHVVTLKYPTVAVQVYEGSIVQNPNKVLNNFDSIESKKSSQVAIPYSPKSEPLTKEELHDELQSFVNSDFDKIKDKYANPEAVPETNPDPGTDPGTNPDPGTGTDPGTNPDPGTEPGKDGVGNLDTDIPSDVKLDFSPLYVNLIDKFPFCIPFDLINSFKSFAVDRQTPKFEVNFDKSVFRGGGSFTIDFSKFTTIAAILRYFLLLVFIVSLIKSTRDLIKG